MNEEFHQAPIEESHEVIQQEALWLAGVIEAGATVAIGIQRKTSPSGHEDIRAYPFISISDNANPQFRHELKSKLGGSVTGSEWRLSGYKAAEIIAETEPYVHSRLEQVMAVRNWLEADTTEAKVKIAEDIKGHDRYNDTSSEDYVDLINRPAFVAGVIDNRGSIYPHIDKNYVYPRIEITSKNKALLDALAKKFKGEVIITKEKGTETDIEGRQFTTKTDSFALTFSQKANADIIRFALPHLKVQPYAGWDEYQSVENAAKRLATQQKILDLITQELSSFNQGVTSQLSTAEEIAAKFNLTHRTTLRYLRTLPQELRQQREQLIRAHHRRKLASDDVATLVEAITREVIDYQQGNRDRLTQNGQWARLANVGNHIIARQIIPLLDPDIASIRQHALLSQTARDRNEVYGNPAQKTSNLL